MTMRTTILMQLYIILFLFSKNIYAHSFGVQVYTPSLHLIKESFTFGDKYSYRLSESGQVVWMPGVKTFYDYGLDNISFNIKKIRIAFGYHKDCMDRSSYVFHTGPRFQFPLSKLFEITIGLGPSLWMRKTWEVFDFYSQDKNINKSSIFPDYEYKWFLFGDIDFIWKINSNLEFVYSLIPAVPYIIAGSMGIIYNL
jgi:hypothetical protein